MVLNAGLRRPQLPAAILSFAGFQLLEEGLPHLSGAPPVLLVLGALERNPERLQETADRLSALSLPVESHLLSGIGHTIDNRGVRLAGEFIRKVAAEKMAAGCPPSVASRHLPPQRGGRKTWPDRSAQIPICRCSQERP